MHTIHLLHHTHTDFGYTDLPPTMEFLQRGYTRRALDLIEAHRCRPEEARFRWTIEVCELARDFLAHASPAERERLLTARAEGLLDVGALPFHPTGFSGLEEWEAIEERLRPTLDVLRPRVAILNDANGLPWGLVPRLLDLGVRWLSTGLNDHSGRPPRPRPSFFRWEGPDGRSLLVWLGMHYCAGFFFFHESEWRRGPIPPAWDVFFHPPEPGDIWRTGESDLAQAERVLQRKLAEVGPYPFGDFALQVTNMWRMDNDPPFGGLPDFVEAWNRSGRSPRLRLSTFEQFFGAAERDAAMSGIPALRGDWVNWWADGIASVPRENVAVRHAARILSDLPGVASSSGMELPAESRELAREAWSQVALYHEHTVDAHNAMSVPDGSLSRGHKVCTSALAYQAEEKARLALALSLRQAPAYVPGRRAQAFSVVNPGPTPRSGWIDFPAEVFERRPRSLRDAATGRLLPLLPVRGPRWSPPRVEDAPPERPNDTFGFETVALRAFLQGVPARSSLRLIPVDAPAEGDAPAHPWQWDWQEGRLMAFGPVDGPNWVDQGAVRGLPFGAVIADADRTFGARQYLTALEGEKTRRGRERGVARIVEARMGSDAYGDLVSLVLEHEWSHRVEQQWRLHHQHPRLEIETTLWLRESFVPLCMALSFPLAPAAGELVYTSLGIPTRVGHDQLPGSCGDFALTEGVIRIGRELVLHAPGVPLAAFGELRVHEGTNCSVPEAPHIFSIFALTHWNTNFPHLTPGKLTLRHVFTTDTAPVDGLIAMPSA